MFRVVVIDDEAIELEGMVSYIAWEAYDMQVVGSAWNGVEGYEVIAQTRPDIVLTDIKMPVMNGLELIEKAQKDFPEIHFVILSGYGEYEFTSRAMMMGVKYYILKPFDEKKVMDVLAQVKQEILIKRAEKTKENQEIGKLLPLARERFFECLLQDGMVRDKDLFFYKDAVSQEQPVQIIVLKDEDMLDMLEGFVLQNIMTELLGEEQVFLHAFVNRELVLMIRACKIEALEVCIRKLKREFKKFSKRSVMAAVSEQGDFAETGRLYQQARDLFYVGKFETSINLLSAESINDKNMDYEFLSRFHNLKNSRDVNSILLESSILFAMFRMKGYSIRDVSCFCQGAFENLGVREHLKLQGEEQQFLDMDEIYNYFTDALLGAWHISDGENKEEAKMQKILRAVYLNLGNRNLSLGWLAKEVLYMNEDYMGRFFSKKMKVKFSAFILEVRMKMAEELIRFEPEVLISDLAELLGFSSDGQYFSKVFKKFTGQKPSEYKNAVMKAAK